MRRLAALLCLFGLVAWNHPPAQRDPGGRGEAAVMAAWSSGRITPAAAVPDGTVVLSHKPTVARPAALHLAGVRVRATGSGD